MFMHYKWVKIEIANRRFLATRTFFQIWKSWPRYLGNGAQVLDFTLKKSEVQHPLDFTFFTVGLHFKFFKKNIGLHRRKCTNKTIVKDWKYTHLINNWNMMDYVVLCNKKKNHWPTHWVDNIDLRDASASKKVNSGGQTSLRFFQASLTNWRYVHSAKLHCIAFLVRKHWGAEGH